MPELVLSAWKRQEDVLGEDAHNVHPDHDRAWLDWRLAVLGLALQKHGGCCVGADEVPQEPKALPPPDPKTRKK